jgi:membrane-associated phospholipid phosphatase
MTVLASHEQAPVAATSRSGLLIAPLATGILAAAATFATYQVFIRTTLGQSVDTSAMRGAEVHHPRVIEVLNRALNGTTLVSLVLVCLVAAAIGVLRKRIDLAVGAALLVLGSNASVQLLKTHLARPHLDQFPAPNSFPSGHTAAAASVAFALVMVLPQAIRGTVALIGSGYVAVIAIATVWAAWHRPSDTVAGLLIVLTWGSLATFGIRAGRYRSLAAPRRPGRLATLPLIAIGAVTAVAGLLGLAAVALSERVTPDFVSGRFAFLTGAACITAAVAGTFLLWMRLASAEVAPGTTPQGGTT